MTAYSTIENAVEAMKHGAYHYVNKPFNLDEVARDRRESARDEPAAARSARVSHEPEPRVRLRRDHRAGASDDGRAKALLERVAASPASTVLLTGETGTGKDLAAKAIHYHSDRAARPFVNITCSALPEQLLESELFGHERGAFTDARQQKRGLFETADGGTVFLDEIGEMTPGLQAKLLRFLEEKTFKRVGGLADIRVDVRVIAATNRNLEDEVKAGKFREDLFYRLQVMPIVLPPLRERRGDVPLLVNFYIDRYNREFRKRVRGADAGGAWRMLEQYRWPGNVRELRNAIERAMLLDRQGPAGAGRLYDAIADGARRARSGCRPRASTSKRSNGNCSCRRSSARSGNQTHAGAAARDQPRPGALSDREVRPDAGGRGAGSGSVSVTTVPPPAGLDTVSDPPCSSALRFAMGRPSPPPRAFVVKKGSSTRSCNRGGDARAVVANPRSTALSV